MDLDIEEALYAAADTMRKTPQYGEVKGSTPSYLQVAKIKTQIIRFLEACPEETTVLELLEVLR